MYRIAILEIVKCRRKIPRMFYKSSDGGRATTKQIIVKPANLLKHSVGQT